MVLVVGWFSLVIEAFILFNGKPSRMHNKILISSSMSIINLLLILICTLSSTTTTTTVIVLAAPRSLFGSNQFVLNQAPSSYYQSPQRESIFIPVTSSSSSSNHHPLSPPAAAYINYNSEHHVYPSSILPSAASLERRLPSQLPPSTYNMPSSNPLVLASCQLPATWAGKWYQAGNKDPIRFTNTEISDRGVCRDRKDDKFLFENRISRCLVCMVINERHINVLQYKESPSDCHISSSSYAAMLQNGHSSHEILDNLCSSITGDAQLESLFRLETPPIECPIIGQYTFTYDNCKVIPSSLESCIDKKQLNFKFNACPDVSGSESKSEVLKCYADWTEGSNYYMIGRLEPTNNNVDRGKFRCFVYEKLPDGQTILMAQSLEETCYGLISASEGPRTMKITTKPTNSRCNFPDYITGREGWISVDNSLIYMFNQNSSNYQVKETREGNVIEEATCIKQVFAPQQMTRRHHQQQQQQQQQQQDNSQQLQYHSHHSSHSDTSYDQFLVQATKNCQTLTYCVRFHKRANSLIQIDFYQRSHHNDESCSDIHLQTRPTYTIALTSAEPQPCPFDGIYSIEAPLESDLSYNPSDLFVCPRQSFLSAQCDDSTSIHIHFKCTTKQTIKNLYCLGSFVWPQPGSTALLLVDDDRQRYQAIIHRDIQQQLGYINAPNAPDNNNQNTLQLSSDATIQLTNNQYNHHQQLQHQMRLSSTNQQQQQQQQQASWSPSIINMSISPITDTNFKISPRNAMKVKLYRRSSCAEVSRSQSSSSSSSSSSSGSSSSAAAAASSPKMMRAGSVVNLLVMTSCIVSTALSLSLLFKNFCTFVM